MRFQFCENSALLKLSWLAIISSDSQTAEVIHGSYVETHEHIFIEGVWSGSFSDGMFTETDRVFGSGGALNRNSVIFVSCGTTCSCLYYGTDGNKTIVLNSLPFLLSELDDFLDPQYEAYDQINRFMLQEINNYIRKSRRKTDMCIGLSVEISVLKFQRFPLSTRICLRGSETSSSTNRISWSATPCSPVTRETKFVNTGCRFTQPSLGAVIRRPSMQLQVNLA